MNLKTAVNAACRAELRTRGFRPIRHVMRRPVDDDALFGVGLNTNASGVPSEIRVNPVVGVEPPG